MADEVSRSGAYRRYRIATKVRALAESRGLSICANPSFDELLEFLRTALVMLLFPSEFVFEDDTEFICFTLAMAPRVLSRIGGFDVLGLPYIELMKRLRDCIDPHEWWDGVWPSKILAAEQWLELEDEVSCGTRGAGKSTSFKIESAIAYARVGKTRREIADLLNVSPSLIRQWIRRYSSLKDALATQSNSDHR